MAYFPYGGKSIFYEEFGQGSPVLFLHGNTASSKMFELLMPLYAEKFRCILLDFLGNGRSDRVERFSPDLCRRRPGRPSRWWSTYSAAKSPLWGQAAEPGRL